MAEISEFQYAYFTCQTAGGGAAMIRIKIPMTLNRSFEPEVKLVFSNPSKPLPSDMGLFSHNHIVYMVGGYNRLKVGGYNRHEDEDEDDDSDLVHMFDPTKFHRIPVENIEQLDNLKCAPMRFPNIIRVEDRIYMISHCDGLRNRNGERLDLNGPFHFQYFDPNKNLFETLPPPPLPTDRAMRIDRCCLGVRCLFFLIGYIYVFITDRSTCSQTSKFDTIKSEWEDCKSMVDRFKEKNIPFPPFDHVGDIGISDEFVGNTWILVALHCALLTAYHVCLSGNGDIEPISHRVLDECNTSDFDMRYSGLDSKQLADMGGGRFCVMHRTEIDEFFIYVFKINFALERTIQISKSGGCSLDFIFKTKFNPEDTIPLNLSVTGFCIASAPPDNKEKKEE